MYSAKVFVAAALVAISLQSASGFVIGVGETNRSTCPNFYHKYEPANDHRVFRIFHNGILAVKVVAEDAMGSVVQQTDGSSLVIAIYRGGVQSEHLAVCNVISQETEIQIFMEHFHGQSDSRSKRRQCPTIEQIVETFGGTAVGPAVGNVSLVPQDMPSLLRQCQGMHHNFDHAKQHEHDKGNDLEGSQKDEPMMTKHGRQRREFTIIIPGTKWCGLGDVADGPGDYGTYSEADKCCQAHDKCRPYIKSWEYKYGVFNYRPWDIPHCNCDDTFYKCLKDINSGIVQIVGAWTVGVAYFNVQSGPCFTTKEEETCSWFFGCSTETKGTVHAAKTY